ncbi:hypothetical protein DS62_04705 [Smithella sp. SC_K08D17]|jgi:hypothetical protein|nr:hypothetical protein KD27_08960 [Smithella sp. D17]KIE17279.1 hypothetical protein DS62_04705 [Smithella sp. SC_K08D17]MDD5342855.1 hypothetical protein [Smithella sp.]MDD5523947.1 hypothetical protein [Smithella sp.]
MNLFFLERNRLGIAVISHPGFRTIAPMIRETPKIAKAATPIRVNVSTPMTQIKMKQQIPQSTR